MGQDQNTDLGAGIAVPMTAYWLAIAGTNVTIVERAASLRAAGQQVDIRDAALHIIRLMDIEEVVEAKTTEEQGLAFVASDGYVTGKFPLGEGRVFTSIVDTIRGDHATILFEAAKDVGEGRGQGTWSRDVGLEFVGAVEYGDEKGPIQVTFGRSQTKRKHDIFIVGDGLDSRIRALVFDRTSSILTQRARKKWDRYHQRVLLD